MTKLPLLLILPLLLSSCEIFNRGTKTSLADYQNVHVKYEAAAEADNLGDGEVRGSSSGYAEVITTVTPAFIGGLPDDKLKPTAWMMRGISEWRTGGFKLALRSASEGLSAQPDAGNRDHILLLMLPALVADSELVSDWQTAGQSYSPEAYAQVESGYKSAMTALASAESAFSPVTSEDTKKLFFLHKKRLLLNWDKIIRTMAADAETKKQAKAAAGAHLGVSTLFDAVIAVNNALAQLSGS
jgi:hypothetical protein